MTISENTISKVMAELGRRGTGDAKRRSKAHYRRAGLESAAKRWGRKKKK
jgi:hypothetical protein